VPFNRAGIVVDPQDDGMNLMTVLPGGPGEGVGLRVGDLITKIDGKVLDGTQDESAFARPVGTCLHLTVTRGQVTQEITVTLNDVQDDGCQSISSQLSVFSSGDLAAKIRLRYRLAGVRHDHDRNGLSLENIVGQHLVFLVAARGTTATTTMPITLERVGMATLGALKHNTTGSCGGSQMFRRGYYWRL